MYLLNRELGDTVRGVLNTVVKGRGSPNLSVKQTAIFQQSAIN